MSDTIYTTQTATVTGGTSTTSTILLEGGSVSGYLRASFDISGSTFTGQRDVYGVKVDGVELDGVDIADWDVTLSDATGQGTSILGEVVGISISFQEVCILHSI